LCSLDGLIKHASSFNTFKIITYLPSGCRPTKRLIFNVNRHTSHGRVDVLSSGQVEWRAGESDGQSGYLSLADIQFTTSTTGQLPIPLSGSWVAYGGSYGSPTYKIVNNRCYLEGLVRYGTGTISILPSACRPIKGRMIFNQNHHMYRSRVDVLTSGEVRFQGGSNNYGWQSLSGISFDVALPIKQVSHYLYFETTILK
jgi:hypothetical protein